MRRSPETERDAVAAALREHETALRAFVRGRVPSEDVDDVLQIAAVRAVEHVASLHDRDRVVAWLYRVHQNVATDAIRKRASRQRLSDRLLADHTAQAFVDPDGATETTCRCSLVQLESLADPYAAILTLVDVSGLSLAEAGEALGISANNAGVRLHRARKALRQRMLEHCGVTSFAQCADCRCSYAGCCD